MHTSPVQSDRRLEREQPGMLEHDVGQLPQQVIEQDHVAGPGRHRSGRRRPARRRVRRAGRRAAAQPRARTGQAPGLGPAQQVAGPRVVGRADDEQHVAGPGQQSQCSGQVRSLDVHRRAAPVCRRSPDARTRPPHGGRGRATAAPRTTWWRRRRTGGPGPSAAAARSSADRDVGFGSRGHRSMAAHRRLPAGRAGDGAPAMSGLAEGQTAVVGRHQMVGQCRRWRRFSSAQASADEEDVLEHSPAQCYRVDPGLMSQRERPRRPSWRPPRCGSRQPPPPARTRRAQIVDDCRKHRARHRSHRPFVSKWYFGLSRIKLSA